MKVKKRTLEFPVKFSVFCYGFSLSADSGVHPTLSTLNLPNRELFINWPKLPVSDLSSLIIYTETIHLILLAYISTLLMCFSLKDENLL